MIIVKIGGGKDINARGIIADLSHVKEPFVIIHGANALRDEIAEILGKPKKTLTSVSGYTSVFSDEDALDVMMMTYSGLKNKRIVELCQQHNINAVGFSGIDGKMIQGLRNRGIRIQEGNKMKIVRDYSGKPRFVNGFLLRLLLSNGYVPVLTVPILDEHGTAINTENDEVLPLIKQALNADLILQLIEAPGILKDPKDPSSTIRKISPGALSDIEKQAEGRMKRKLLALRKLFENGSSLKVVISDGRRAHPVKDALAGKGTVIS